jgi:hypothetical protein
MTSGVIRRQLWRPFHKTSSKTDLKGRLGAGIGAYLPKGSTLKVTTVLFRNETCSSLTATSSRTLLSDHVCWNRTTSTYEAKPKKLKFTRDTDHKNLQMNVNLHCHENLVSHIALSVSTTRRIAIQSMGRPFDSCILTVLQHTAVTDWKQAECECWTKITVIEKCLSRCNRKS